MEDWEKSFQADVLGLINLINSTAPHLDKRNGDGSIIVISSLAGFEAKHPRKAGPYTTLKRAQATLAKDYGRVLGPKNIRINTIVPGAVDSPGVVLPDGTEQPSDFSRAMAAIPEYRQSLLSEIPLVRFGHAKDVANAVIFLGSRLSQYINGVNLIVDGGMSTFL